MMESKLLWILDVKGNPVHEPDVVVWGQWFEFSGEERTMAFTTFCDAAGKDVVVSTVFTGMDQGMGIGAPVLYETMVWRGEDIEEGYRYRTKEEAVAGHASAVKAIEESDDRTA